MSASIGFSSSTSNSSLTEHLAHVGYWEAGQDVSLTAGHDMNIEGTVSQAGRYLSVAAANNLTIQSALSTIDESSSSHSVKCEHWGLRRRGAYGLHARRRPPAPAS